MELWSGTLSPFSAKVRIALAEKGLDYEIREVPWSRATLWGPKPAEFLAVSPRGQVPVLIDGDAVVYVSTGIAEYLRDGDPTPPLLPADAVGRARCRLLEDEADQAMVLHVTPLVQELFTKTGDAARDLARVAAATGDLTRRYDDLERELADRDYLCGSFGLADIATFMVVSFASTLGVATGPKHRRLAAVVTRSRARPTLVREFAAMMAAAAAA